MSKKSVFTTITPLPSTISRETANAALHDHKLMIDLNPLVIERKLVPKAPHFASAEEFNCKWYLITDRFVSLPRSGGVKSRIYATPELQRTQANLHCGSTGYHTCPDAS